MLAFDLVQTEQPEEAAGDDEDEGANKKSQQAEAGIVCRRVSGGRDVIDDAEGVRCFRKLRQDAPALRSRLGLAWAAPMHLAQVSLPEQGLGDRAVRTLVEALVKGNIYIERLELYKNRLGNAAAQALGVLLECSPLPGVRRLHLSHNYFTQVGVGMMLIAAVRSRHYPLKSPTLTPLWLRVENQLVDWPVLTGLKGHNESERRVRAEQLLKHLEEKLLACWESSGAPGPDARPTGYKIFVVPDFVGVSLEGSNTARNQFFSGTGPMVHLPYFHHQGPGQRAERWPTPEVATLDKQDPHWREWWVRAATHGPLVRPKGLPELEGITSGDGELGLGPARIADRANASPPRTRDMQALGSGSMSRVTSPPRSPKPARVISPQRSAAAARPTAAAGETRRAASPPKLAETRRDASPPAKSGEARRGVSPAKSGEARRAASPAKAADAKRGRSPPKSSNSTSRGASPQKSGGGSRAAASVEAPARGSGGRARGRGRGRGRDKKEIQEGKEGNIDFDEGTLDVSLADLQAGEDSDLSERRPALLEEGTLDVRLADMQGGESDISERKPIAAVKALLEGVRQQKQEQGEGASGSSKAVSPPPQGAARAAEEGAVADASESEPAFKRLRMDQNEEEIDLDI